MNSPFMGQISNQISSDECEFAVRGDPCAPRQNPSARTLSVTCMALISTDAFLIGFNAQQDDVIRTELRIGDNFEGSRVGSLSRAFSTADNGHSDK